MVCVLVEYNHFSTALLTTSSLLLGTNRLHRIRDPRDNEKRAELEDGLLSTDRAEDSHRKDANVFPRPFCSEEDLDLSADIQ